MDLHSLKSTSHPFLSCFQAASLAWGLTDGVGIVFTKSYGGFLKMVVPKMDGL